MFIDYIKKEGLCLRKKPPRRRKACIKREIPPIASRKNECWSVDFMSDQLFDGRRIRLLAIVDNYTRESLSIYVDQRIRGIKIVEVLEKVVLEHGMPERIKGR